MLPASSAATHRLPDGQDTPSSEWPGSISLAVHAPVPASGSVVVTMCPALSTATHSDVEGQERLVRLLTPSTARCTDHVPAPASGAVEVTAFPSPSTATQSDADGHDKSFGPISSFDGAGPVMRSTAKGVHALAPPVGSVEATTSPEGPATPTHSVVDAQDTPWMCPTPPTFAVTVHACVPRVGSVEVRTLPVSSTATHSAAEGQDILRRPWSAKSGSCSTVVDCQALTPPVGSVEVTTLPNTSPATHSEVDGHDTLVRPPGRRSTAAIFQAPGPPVGSVELRT